MQALPSKHIPSTQPILPIPGNLPWPLYDTTASISQQLTTDASTPQQLPHLGHISWVECRTQTQAVNHFHAGPTHIPVSCIPSPAELSLYTLEVPMAVFNLKLLPISISKRQKKKKEQKAMTADIRSLYLLHRKRGCRLSCSQARAHLQAPGFGAQGYSSPSLFSCPNCPTRSLEVTHVEEGNSSSAKGTEGIQHPLPALSLPPPLPAYNPKKKGNEFKLLQHVPFDSRQDHTSVEMSNASELI